MTSSLKAPELLSNKDALLSISIALKANSYVKTILAQKIAQKMLKSFSKVLSLLQKARYQKITGKNWRELPMIWPSEKDCHSVHIYGSFTYPPWKKGIEMKYSPRLSAYTALVKMREYCRFVFYVDGVQRILPEFETSELTHKQYINIFSLNTYISITSARLNDDPEGKLSTFFVSSKKTENPKQEQQGMIYNTEQEQMKESYKEIVVYQKNQIKQNVCQLTIQQPIFQKMNPEINPIQAEERKIINCKKGRSFRSYTIDYGEDISHNSSIGSSFLPKIDTHLNLVKAVKKQKAVFDVSFEMFEKRSKPALKAIRKQTDNLELLETGKELPLPPKFKEVDNIKGKEESKTKKIEKMKEFTFICDAISFPKTGTNGEDAYFTTPRVLGIADGVSGWWQYGIDSSDFSLELMSYCEEEAIQLKDEPEIDPMEILDHSYNKVDKIGSSTAALVAINQDKLHGINLGDSGFLCYTLIEGEYVNNGVSKEQQHNFNTPYQLSRLPNAADLAEIERNISREDFLQLKKILENGDLCQDLPSMADRYTLQLHDKDIIILGTDGLFDNLFKDEIKKYMREVMRNEKIITPELVHKLAKTIAMRAYEKSKAENVKTPFQTKYRKEFRSNWSQGKEDDIIGYNIYIKEQYYLMGIYEMQFG